MASRRRWSMRQRAEAIRLYRTVGITEAVQRTGIPEKTIRTWVTRAAQITGEDETKMEGPALEGAVADAALHKKGLDAQGGVTPETYERLSAIRKAEAMAGIEAARSRQAVLREQLRETLLAKALDALQRMDEPHIEFKGKDAVQVQYPKAPAGAFQNYATSAAILLDKYRLEVGESTSRAEIELRAHIEEAAKALGVDPATVWIEAERLVADQPLQLTDGLQVVRPVIPLQPDPAIPLQDPPTGQQQQDG